MYNERGRPGRRAVPVAFEDAHLLIGLILVVGFLAAFALTVAGA
ncbi:hypothetical protein [Spongiactinospora sp. TRM90649]|nr:hypothetical protein [Spongiactinospora sp. TRM90649]MDF5757195.1 hypothetical protein [Spongiactinospora sp. TRM90649]